MTKFTRNHYVY